MNKTEKEILLRFQRQASLNLPPYEEPQPIDLKMASSTKLIVGWWINPHVVWGYGTPIGQGCSNGIHHSTSHTDKTTSQGSGRFYATELEAYKALRWAVTRQVMEKLAAIDARISAIQTDPDT